MSEQIITQHRVWVYGDHINTDVIFAGKYTYTLKTPDEFRAHVLEDLDIRFASNVQDGDVIIAGRNWGCGSSREQAVTALKYAGIKMIIADSFSGLYQRNCINQGIRPVQITGLSQQLQTGDTIEIDYIKNRIIANGQTWNMPTLSNTVQAILDAGGLLPMLQARFAHEWKQV